jgi:hypothetical protein
VCDATARECRPLRDAGFGRVCHARPEWWGDAAPHDASLPPMDTEGPRKHQQEPLRARLVLLAGAAEPIVAQHGDRGTAAA